MDSFSFLFWKSEGSIEKTKILISDEFPQDFKITGVMRQVLVPFRGCSSNSWQIVPRTGWKIMMFDMVSKVKIEKVPNTKIIIRFHSCHKFGMFCDCVNGGWMTSNWEKCCQKNVSKRSTSPEFINENIWT